MTDSISQDTIVGFFVANHLFSISSSCSLRLPLWSTPAAVTSLHPSPIIYLYFTRRTTNGLKRPWRCFHCWDLSNIMRHVIFWTSGHSSSSFSSFKWSGETFSSSMLSETPALLFSSNHPSSPGDHKELKCSELMDGTYVNVNVNVVCGFLLDAVIWSVTNWTCCNLKKDKHASWMWNQVGIRFDFGSVWCSGWKWCSLLEGRLECNQRHQFTN